MVPVFSASSLELGEVSVLAELEFLPDQELMSLWEQTQFAMAAIEGRGGRARMARAYEYAVLMEMQRRLVGRSVHELFGSDDIRLEYDMIHHTEARG
ncbi:hypothetical protein [Mailhella massiliensis]|uniref:Uncharacterized protein n=1 Tax=Mailhella massiliensis TaxID=1903261 RepID=A0A921AY60_9BACT|nr:hypothetical protein [Mailhella massiliensis]HJD98039.1 hypothetical protein [Mailhella massiliensis]